MKITLLHNFLNLFVRIALFSKFLLPTRSKLLSGFFAAFIKDYKNNPYRSEHSRSVFLRIKDNVIK